MKIISTPSTVQKNYIQNDTKEIHTKSHHSSPKVVNINEESTNKKKESQSLITLLDNRNESKKKDRTSAKTEKNKPVIKRTNKKTYTVKNKKMQEIIKLYTSKSK